MLLQGQSCLLGSITVKNKTLVCIIVFCGSGLQITNYRTLVTSSLSTKKQKKQSLITTNKRSSRGYLFFAFNLEHIAVCSRNLKMLLLGPKFSPFLRKRSFPNMPHMATFLQDFVKTARKQIYCFFGLGGL